MFYLYWAILSKGLPIKEKLNALIAAEKENSETKILTQVNPLQFLNSIQPEATHKGLIHVELLMGG